MITRIPLVEPIYEMTCHFMPFSEIAGHLVVPIYDMVFHFINLYYVQIFCVEQKFGIWALENDMSFYACTIFILN